MTSSDIRKDALQIDGFRRQFSEVSNAIIGENAECCWMSYNWYRGQPEEPLRWCMNQVTAVVFCQWTHLAFLDDENANNVEPQWLLR